MSEAIMVRAQNQFFKSTKTYGIKIDTTNGDPNTAVTYIDDAVGFTPISVSDKGIDYGTWKLVVEDFIGCKPCMIKNGIVNYYLDRSNYNKKEKDGTTADITSGNDGDVFVEFKKLWYRWSKVGTDIYFQISDADRSGDGFVTTAFSDEIDGSDAKYFYYGAYEGYVENNKLRSLSGKAPLASSTLSNTRTWAKNLSSNLGIESFAKRWYLIGISMLVCKARNLRSVLGRGVMNNGASTPITTGTLNFEGLFAGSISSNDKANKCFGIENLWGSAYQFIDGLMTKSTTTIGLKGKAPYSDGGTDYEVVEDGFTRGSSRYPTDMMVVLDNAGMLATTAQTDATKGWSTMWYVRNTSGEHACVSGCYSSTNPGIAYFDVDYAATETLAKCGARLVR